VKIEELEASRLQIQDQLDFEKTAKARNIMGQFATPTALARDIIAYGMTLLPKDCSVRFLDPGFGTGSFYSALLSEKEEHQVETAKGFEVDPHYGHPAQALWSDHPVEILIDDFTTSTPSQTERVNFLISNPPYVRHHHLTKEQKDRLKISAELASGVKIGGLCGLYCYFMALSHKWMEEDGIGGWLIPSEFMDVNYGRQLKSYLLDQVTLIKIHRFDPNDAQFEDALVSSAVVWIKNAKPPVDHKVTFSFGGSLLEPKVERDVSVRELRSESKWTRYPTAQKPSKKPLVCVGDLFEVKRGIATGDNGFFIMNLDQIKERDLPLDCFRPILPSSRYLKADHITADSGGIPLISRQLYLLDTKLSFDEIKQKYPSLANYLETGGEGEKPVKDRYLCQSRSPWYSQERRPPPPMLCTYMGRPRNGSKPFRFILNESEAIATNVYLLMYPRPFLASLFEDDDSLQKTVWEFFNSLSTRTLLDAGRVYGGGLHKLEPRELKSMSVDSLLTNTPKLKELTKQTGLFTRAA